MALEAQRSDEDVDEDREEDEHRGCIVHPVQLGVFPSIIQIILHNKDEQQSYDDLQSDGQSEQNDERDVEAVIWSHIQDGLQLGRVGHQ